MIKELIWQEYLQSLLVEEKKLFTAGSVINILSPEKRLNCESVTIQIGF